MRPPSGRSKPAIMRRSVVLPQPEGPSSVKNSPASTEKLTSSTAVKSPKRRVTLRISSSAIGRGPGITNCARIVSEAATVSIAVRARAGEAHPGECATRDHGAVACVRRHAPCLGFALHQHETEARGVRHLSDRGAGRRREVRGNGSGNAGSSRPPDIPTTNVGGCGPRTRSPESRGCGRAVRARRPRGSSACRRAPRRRTAARRCRAAVSRRAAVRSPASDGAR